MAQKRSFLVQKPSLPSDATSSGQLVKGRRTVCFVSIFATFGDRPNPFDQNKRILSLKIASKSVLSLMNRNIFINNTPISNFTEILKMNRLLSFEKQVLSSTMDHFVSFWFNYCSKWIIPKVFLIVFFRFRSNLRSKLYGFDQWTRTVRRLRRCRDRISLSLHDLRRLQGNGRTICIQQTFDRFVTFSNT